MAQVSKCDECGKIGAPGETWVRVQVTPEYLPGNKYSDGPVAMEMDYVRPSGQAQTCSVACALERLRKSLLDLETWAVEMGSGVDTLLEQQKTTL